MGYRLLFILCLFMVLVMARSVMSSVDDLQLAIDESTGLSLRWDNLTGDDEWLAGPKPEKYEGKYRVRLKPGEYLLLLMNGDSWLRIVDEKRTDNDWIKGIRLQQATDGRLFMEKKLYRTNLKNNFLMKPPRQAYVARLENVSEEPRVLSLYASRQFISSPRLRYKKIIPLDLETVDLQIIPNVGWQQHYIMPAGKKIEFTLQGPTRIAITMRQPMGDLYRHQIRSRLDIYKGEEKIRSQEIYFKEDVRHTIHVQGQRKILSAPETQYLSLSEGEHTIGLVSAVEIYLQLDSLGTQFFSNINIPESILWMHDEKSVLRKSSLDMDHYMQNLQNKAQDNRKTEDIPKLVYIQSNKIKADNLPYKKQDEVFEKIKNRHMSFNSALPVVGQTYQQRWFRYLTNSLDYTKRRKPYYFSEKFLDERLASIEQDVFYRLEEKSFQFSYEDSVSETEIRLLVYAGYPEADTKIYMQFDNEPPQTLEIVKNRAGDYIHDSINKAALNRQPSHVSVLGKLAVDRGSLPLIQPASMIINLKPGIKTIRLWQDAMAKPIWLSLQFRQPRAYQLSEAQYLYELGQSDHELNDFLSAINQYKKQQDEGEYNSRLINHWLPVFESWHTAYRFQIEKLELLSANMQDFYSQDALDDLQLKAIDAMQSEQWLLAIEYWSELWPVASGNRQEMALQKLLVALKKNGQYGLSQSLQKAVIFGSFSQNFIYQQLNDLLEYYRSQEKTDAIVSLVTAFFMHRPDKNSFQLLAESLSAEGYWTLALQLQLLAPGLFNKESILYSALQTGWMQSFDKILHNSAIEDKHKYKWLALKALLLKQYDAAEDYLRKTEKWGEKRLDILRRSREIHTHLLSSDQKIRELAISQWQALQLEILSTERTKWQADNSIVMSHGGMTRLERREDNIKQDYYVMEPGGMIKVKLAGPAWLRLQIRPLHPLSQSGRSLNSTYYIEDGENRKRLLINNNSLDEHWIVNGNLKKKGLLPGNKIYQILFVGTGVHNIHLKSDNYMLLRLQRKRPYIYPSILPELSIDGMVKVLSDDQTPMSVSDDVVLDNKWLSSDIWFDESLKQQELVNIALEIEQPGKVNKNDLSALIAKAEKIYFDSGYDIRLSSIMSRIRAHSHWELLDTIDRSDGVWVKRFDNWQAESPAGRVFQALSPSSAFAQDLLINGSSLVLSLFNPEATPIDIQLKSVSPIFIRTHPLRMSYQLDDNKAVEKIISGEMETIKINVPQGRHSLKFRLLNAPLHHRLWLSVLEGDKQRIGILKSRRYQLASASRPLRYFVQGPAWLRIDKLYNGMTQSRYKYIENENAKLYLTSTDSGKNALYRVFYRALNPPVKVPDTVNKSQNIIIKEPLISTNTGAENDSDSIKYIKDEWRLGQQQNGTFSYQVGQISRDLIAGELSGNGDEYMQAGVSYRHYQHLSERWFYLSALGRYRQNGSGSLGIKSRLRGQFDFMPVDWALDGRVFGQRINDSFEWSAQAQLILSQYRPLGRYFYHLPKAQISRRWLSMENSLDNNIDQDVFTQYKVDHQSVLRLSETLVYQPYQDMQIYLGGERISNPNWMDTDQIRGRFGWRMLWGNTRWDINARKTDFWADDDRTLDRTRRVFQARVLLEKWYKPRLRIELSASLDRDMDTDDKTLRVQLSLYQSEGRGYIDFSPTELLFRDLREARLTPELNNGLK